MKITEILVAEHRVMLRVFDQIDRTLPTLINPADARMLAHIVEGMLEGHARTETELAYLALDHVLEEKGQLVRLHEEHEEIDANLRWVQTADSGAEARRLLAAAIVASRNHFFFEEQFVFPLLEQVMQGDTLNELAAALPAHGQPGCASR